MHGFLPEPFKNKALPTQATAWKPCWHPRARQHVRIYHGPAVEVLMYLTYHSLG